MYFFLPNEKDGLSTLVEKLASESDFIRDKLSLEKVKVGDFKIPRFKFSFGLETSEILKELGVVLPFFGGGLTKMVDSLEEGQNLFVSNIFHKSFIKVNEKGTEAAAASALKCALGISLSPRLDFVADHPFLFLIREDLSGTLLFVGQVLNPIAG
ncbi:serpin-ZX [Trifolium medium]|uniref:Serpin-ZX n=1 Tax=Trifolium medium TaxID=97028 RepID=A0A392NUX1_9FABA|nr:serpin-ZX [Trifolium medium]